MPISAAESAATTRHLRRVDPKLRPIISAVGPFVLKPHRDRFRMLARSIVSQQLSTAAARTISGRIEALVAPESISHASLERLTTEQLRAAGLSRQKVEFMRDLCRRVASGEVELRRLGRYDDETVIERLTAIKGIGRWTAQMFLIFALGRPDVLPEDDLGVRSAVRHLHGLAETPSKSQFRELAAPWRPYASVASWYCWRSLDLKVLKPATA